MESLIPYGILGAALTIGVVLSRVVERLVLDRRTASNDHAAAVVARSEHDARIRELATLTAAIGTLQQRTNSTHDAVTELRGMLTGYQALLARLEEKIANNERRLDAYARRLEHVEERTTGR